MTNIGDWVQYTRPEFIGYKADIYGIEQATYRPITKAWLVASITLNGETAVLERWRAPQITRRTKVFGHYVDRTPFRELRATTAPAADCKPIHASVAKQLAATNDGVMKLPTRAERDNARQKRRNARKVN